MAKVNLLIAEEVNSNQSSAETYVVPNGKNFEITKARGSGITGNSTIAIIWDYDGAGEKVLWYINGDGSFPYAYEGVGDGVKKIAVELQNGPGGSRALSGFLQLRVED